MKAGRQTNGSYFSSLKSSEGDQRRLCILLGLGIVAGYMLGMIIMETADVMFTTGAEHHIKMDGISVTTVSEVQSDKPTTQVLQPKKHAGDSVHSLLTSNGSPYQNFQARIMYGTYKLIQQMPGGEKMTGFTRILHRMTDDSVVGEIPTFRAKPLHPECDTWCEFPVADRPNAVQQWIDAADKDPSMIQGAWLFLIECDYVWMKPMKAPDAYTNSPGVQFHFDYIQPEYPGVPDTLRRMAAVSGIDLAPGTKVPPSGPAPAMLRFSELKAVTPHWEKVTAAIEADAKAKEFLGWVREMYAWDIALVAGGVDMTNVEAGLDCFFAQPPHDHRIDGASLLHYTWGAIYNDSKGEVFKWDKREYTDPKLALKVPHIPMPPQPWEPNKWHLQANEPVTKDMHESLTAMLAQMNKAIDMLPDLSSIAARNRKLSM